MSSHWKIMIISALAFGLGFAADRAAQDGRVRGHPMSGPAGGTGLEWEIERGKLHLTPEGPGRIFWVFGPKLRDDSRSILPVPDSGLQIPGIQRLDLTVFELKPVIFCPGGSCVRLPCEEADCTSPPPPAEPGIPLNLNLITCSKRTCGPW